MTATHIEIETRDGICPATFYGDAGAPGVLVYIDGIGMRPSMHAIAKRIAAQGYRVLLPDLFYRLGAYTAPEPKAFFSDPTVRSAWFANMKEVASPEKVMSDTAAFLDKLKGPVAVTGYCMGGRMAYIAAATYADRIAAAAAYHPGGLVTDAADSPHLLAAKIRGKIYLGRAVEDAGFTDEHQRALEKALSDAGVDHVIEQYPARHGWVPDDTPVHDAKACARHDETLFALLKDTLGLGTSK